MDWKTCSARLRTNTFPSPHMVPSMGGPFLVLQKNGLSGWLHHSCLHGSKVRYCVREQRRRVFNRLRPPPPYTVDAPPYNTRASEDDRARHHSPVSRRIVLMRTDVIHLLNRVPEHDSLTFFVLHRTKCKLMHFERECFADVTLTLNPNP